MRMPRPPYESLANSDPIVNIPHGLKTATPARRFPPPGQSSRRGWRTMSQAMFISSKNSSVCVPHLGKFCLQKFTARFTERTARHRKLPEPLQKVDRPSEMQWN